MSVEYKTPANWNAEIHSWLPYSKHIGFFQINKVIDLNNGQRINLGAKSQDKLLKSQNGICFQ